MKYLTKLDGMLYNVFNVLSISFGKDIEHPWGRISWHLQKISDIVNMFETGNHLVSQSFACFSYRCVNVCFDPLGISVRYIGHVQHMQRYWKLHLSCSLSLRGKI